MKSRITFDSTILVLRIVFMLVAITGSYLLCYVIADWDEYRWRSIFIGTSIGVLVILIDIFLKGFSLRGLSALTFGLFVGWLMAYFISHSPLFENADPSIAFIARLAVFVILMYLASVIALRGKDEFNLVIPYVRFVPNQVDVPLAVVDTSSLIDGRIVGVCGCKFMGYALVIPSFVIDELHRIADSRDPVRQAKGRKGIESLNRLKGMSHLDLRVHDSDLPAKERNDAKIIYIAQSLKAKILSTDYNLAQIAEFHNVDWLNINSLAKALNPELVIGERLQVALVKGGKEEGQAVGYLSDGSMVVVNDADKFIGRSIMAEVQSIIPSAGGKMIFANRVSRSSHD